MGNRIIRSGVYQIMNEVNGKSYVGSSKDINNRWSCWKRNFTLPMNYKSLLKAAVQKYGIENFTFIILEECAPTKEALEALENHYLQQIKPAYNIIEQSYAPTGRKHPHSEDTKAKIRAKRALQTNVRQKGYKMSQPAWNKGLPSPHRGKTRPAEVGAKISQTMMGHAVSEETRAKLRANNGMSGRHHSETTKQKMRTTHLARLARQISSKELQ